MTLIASVVALDLHPPSFVLVALQVRGARDGRQCARSRRGPAGRVRGTPDPQGEHDGDLKVTVEGQGRGRASMTVTNVRFLGQPTTFAFTVDPTSVPAMPITVRLDYDDGTQETVSLGEHLCSTVRPVATALIHTHTYARSTSLCFFLPPQPAGGGYVSTSVRLFVSRITRNVTDGFFAGIYIIFTIEELIICERLGLGLGLGLRHLLLAGDDILAEVCTLPSALWF